MSPSSRNWPGELRLLRNHMRTRLIHGCVLRHYADDMSNTQPLSDYWEANELRGGDSPVQQPESPPLESPLSLRLRAHGDRSDNAHRSRAFSDAIVLESPRPALTPFHPASSLPDFLDAFGPLVFPLYRAALLRKRILFMAEAPVNIPCNYGTAVPSGIAVASLQLTQRQCMICLY